MATLFEKMVELKEKRESLSNQGGPFAKTLDKTIAGMKTVASAVDRLQLAVKDQIAANALAKKTGEATDVQQSIRDFLQRKIAEDDIERERHKRMMDMAESLVPKVNDEQLKLKLPLKLRRRNTTCKRNLPKICRSVVSRR